MGPIGRLLAIILLTSVGPVSGAVRHPGNDRSPGTKSASVRGDDGEASNAPSGLSARFIQLTVKGEMLSWQRFGFRGCDPSEPTRPVARSADAYRRCRHGPARRTRICSDSASCSTG